MKERDNYDLHLWDGLTQGFINKDEYLELMSQYEEPWVSNSLWCS